MEGRKAIVYYPKVGSVLDESKNSEGGVNAVRYRTRFVPIHDLSFFKGTLNVYCLIKQYFIARDRARITCSRFFLGVTSGKKEDAINFFKNQPVGRNACSTIVNTVCNALEIRGNGQGPYMTTHGLRATMISLLIS